MTLLGRSFQVRGKDVHLRELTDLVALHPSEIRSKSGAEKVFENESSGIPRLKSEELNALAPEVSLPEVRAFEDSGWVFIPRDKAQDLLGTVPEAKVFIKSSGRLALGLSSLVVKLPHDPREAEASEILQPYGVRILEKVNFAPGLFRVEVVSPSVGDAVDVANKLIESGVSEIAEPELLEIIGLR